MKCHYSLLGKCTLYSTGVSDRGVFYASLPGRGSLSPSGVFSERKSGSVTPSDVLWLHMLARLNGSEHPRVASFGKAEETRGFAGSCLFSSANALHKDSAIKLLHLDAARRISD